MKRLRNSALTAPPAVSYALGLYYPLSRPPPQARRTRAALADRGGAPGPARSRREARSAICLAPPFFCCVFLCSANRRAQNSRKKTEAMAALWLRKCKVCVPTRSPASLTILRCPAPSLAVAAPSVEITPWGGFRRRLLGRRGDLLRRHRCLGGARRLRKTVLAQRAARWYLQPPTSDAPVELVELVVAARRGSRCGSARLAMLRRRLPRRRRRCGRRCRASCGEHIERYGCERLEVRER